MLLLSSFLLSLFITMALIPVFSRLGERMHVLDVPDWRKVHGRPVPRVGGFAMAIGTLVSSLLWIKLESFPSAYLIGAAVIVAVGILDDTRGLDYRAKFSGQVAAALILILAGGVKITTLGNLLPESVVLPDWFAVPFTLLVIVGVTNAINLADGLDGLAGGICLISLGCLGYLAFLEGDTVIVLFAVTLSCAILGFLRFNTFPATVFMGDTGSLLIGFSVIALALNLTQGQTALSPLLPLLIIGFPIIDTITVMAERLAEKRPLFTADKKHLHYKIMGLGFYHTEAVLGIYIMQAAFVISAFAFRFYSEWFILGLYLALALLFVGVLLLGEEKKWRFKRQGVFDRLIKGRLKSLRERRIFIRAPFFVVKIGLPLLLGVTCFLPETIPPSFGIACVIAGVAIALSRLSQKPWGRWIFITALYLFIPFIIFFAEMQRGPSIENGWMRLYNGFYIFLVVGVILTMRATKRRQGFRLTPTDFLILFIILCVPLLPGDYAKEYHLGAIAIRVVVLFFSYEVLIGELRDRLGPLTGATVAALFLVAARSLLGR